MHIHIQLLHVFIHFRNQQSEDFVCVKFRCHLNSDTFKYYHGQLSYKYTVYTNQVTKENAQYEFLHETQNAVTNREIHVPLNNCIANGMPYIRSPCLYIRVYLTSCSIFVAKIIHFDNIVYPSVNEQSTAWYTKIMPKMSSSTRSQTSTFKVNESEMTSTCLNFYLSPLKKSISCGTCKYTENCDVVWDSVDKVMNVFTCLHRRYYHNDRKRVLTQQHFERYNPSVKQVFAIIFQPNVCYFVIS